jgi:hypothetical protein
MLCTQVVSTNILVEHADFISPLPLNFLRENNNIKKKEIYQVLISEIKIIFNGIPHMFQTLNFVVFHKKSH